MFFVFQYSLRLLYVAIGVGLSAFVGKLKHLTIFLLVIRTTGVNFFFFCPGICAFAEGLCWTRTAERQTSRMRKEYLKSVLRQEVGFFDTQEQGSSTTFQVVSTISNDSNSIQVAICEKVRF